MLKVNMTYSLGTVSLAVMWSEFAIGTTVFLMRVYTNAVIQRRWKADFWWALVTYISAVIATALFTVCVAYGVGQHLADLELNHPEFVVKNQFYEQLYTFFALIAIPCGKVAIVAFILGIEGTTIKPFRRRLLWVMAALTLAINGLTLIFTWLQCDPTPKIWDFSLPGNCNFRIAAEYYAYFGGSFSALMDIFLALYPVFIFWSLKMATHVKVGLTGLFGFSVVACISSIIKTTEIGSLTAQSDITYQIATLDIWTATEMWIVFIASCVPAIRPIFAKLLGKTHLHNSKDPTNPTHRGYLVQRENTMRSRAYASDGVRQGDVIGPKMSSESEEDILGGHDGIVMTRNVSIHYEGSELDRDRSARKVEWKAHFEAV